MNSYSIPESIYDVLDRLEKAGFEAYIVGGWVRDRLLNLEDQDCDLTTNASPEQIQAVFSDLKQSEIGKDHGTIGVKVDHQWIEITTYRIDQEIHDHRHPKSVVFTHDLKEDLLRRDFTINALAMTKDGMLVDLIEGQRDLEAQRIRCVGDPHLRFEEDALRILRALRLSSKLGFRIEENTLRAMHTHKTLIHTLAVERIWHEFEQWMTQTQVTQTLVESLDIVREFMPEVDTVPFEWIQRLDQQPFILRMMALFYASTDETLLKRCHDLKISKALQHTIQDRLHALKEEPSSELDLKRLMGRYPYDALLDAFEFKRRFMSDRYQADHVDKLKLFKETDVCVSLAQLALKGHDVMALGYTKEGIKNALERCLEEVLCGRVQNEKAALIQWLKNPST